MQKFTITDIPDLDLCVLASLEALSAQKLPSFHFSSYKRPLVIGSGNAAATGKILFHDSDAVFADESSYVEKLEKIKAIDGVILISASGGKHAPGIAKNVQQWDKPFYLLTNNPNSIAARSLSPKQILVFPKNREPYTYNVSTYMSMILAKTREDPKKILDFITTTIDSIALPDFSSYGAFCVIIPPQFLEIFITHCCDVSFQPADNTRGCFAGIYLCIIFRNARCFRSCSLEEETILFIRECLRE